MEPGVKFYRCDNFTIMSGLVVRYKVYTDNDYTGEISASREGVWASRDGERAMLLAQTKAQGADTDGQEAALNLIRQQFDDLRQSTGFAETRLLLSGPGQFAVNARTTIKAEVFNLTLISSLAIIAVLFFVYRSLRLMTLGLLPVASGMLAGVVAVSLAYGTVFGITVGFGAALIGEAVDYSTRKQRN